MDWGVCWGLPGSSLPRFFAFMSPCPARPPMLAALSATFLLIDYAKQTAPELPSLTQRRGLDAAPARRRGVGAAKAAPCSAFPMKGMGNNHGKGTG